MLKIYQTTDFFLANRTPRLKVFNQTTGKVTSSRYQVGSLAVIAVHKTHDDKVILGAINSEKQDTVRRVVVMFNWNGKKLKKWEYDKNKHRMFWNPRLISSSLNGNIFIADIFGADVGRLVVLGQDGIEIDTYDGQPTINEGQMKFWPSFITRTPSDHFLIGDNSNDIFYFLDNARCFVSSIDTASVGILYPGYLTFTNNRKAYIGCLGTGDENIKLYETAFSE